MIKIALPKGRLGDKVLAQFEAAGYACPEIHTPSRKLVFSTDEVSYFYVKPSDVPIYVERGVADIGVAGGDKCGLIFKKGEILRKVPENEILPALLEEIGRM